MLARTKKAELKGKILVIDPGYLFSDNIWDQIVLLEHKVNGYFKIKGYTFYLAETAYGDGLFPLKLEKKTIGILVNSGLIALIPEKTYNFMLKKNYINPYINPNEFGYWVFCKEPLVIRYDDGDIITNQFSIITHEEVV